MKKATLYLLLVSLFFSLQGYVVQAETEPSIYGQYGIAIDAATGEILYEKNAREKAYPASITKIMTSIILMENSKKGEEWKVSEEAAGQEASNYYFKLKKGEKITRENALKAMMVISANDAAMTIAENVGGSRKGFADLMNQKVKQLGLKDTHFVTPSGLHDSEHYTTAYDMAIITREALKYDEITKIMGTKQTTVNTNKTKVDITNPSKIHETPLSIGGKTGYTNAAQNTLVMIMEKDGKKIIGVVMKTTRSEEYSDISKMAEYGFEKMKKKTLLKKGEPVKKVTLSGQEVTAVAADTFVFTYTQKKDSDVTRKYTWETPTHSVRKGDVIGKVQFFRGDTAIGSVDLLASRDLMVETEKEKTSTKGVPVIIFGLLFPIPFYLYYIIMFHRKKK